MSRRLSDKAVLYLFCALMALLTLHTLQAEGYRNIDIRLPDRAGVLAHRATEAFMRIVEEHAGRKLSGDKGLLTIVVVPDTLAACAESYSIRTLDRDTITISAHSEKGLMYGLGKVLHSGYFSDGKFFPGDCSGVFSPDKPVRGIYLATHFGNYYVSAPLEEVTRYIEELALWGYNSLLVWYDLHTFDGIDDPDAVKMRQRLAFILKAAGGMGMETGLTMLANEGYATTPDSLKAVNPGFTDFYGTEICPFSESGTDLILRNVSETLEAFKEYGVVIDRLQLWPYDQGGCGCANCSPWGGNGYMRISEKISSMVRERLPDIKITLSTWLFDFREQDKGEWAALAEEFSHGKPWADAIMADSHTDFPRYPLEHQSPGGLPLLNFPEISMWGNFPWGGYGALPLPLRMERLWNEVKDIANGGYPYSEGIYEDINKVIYSRFYWESGITARRALEDYVRFEFSEEYVDQIVGAIEIIEKNSGMSSHAWATREGAAKAIRMPSKDHGAARAAEILMDVNRRLPANVRKGWRWQLLLRRAVLDRELRQSGGVITRKADRSFRRITKIQHLEDAHLYVQPPQDRGRDYPVAKIH